MNSEPEAAYIVRPAKSEDRSQWQELWMGYNRFYQTALPADVTESTWQRILDNTSAIECLLVQDAASGKLLGFVHYVVHPRTWSVNDACYLEDLYVSGESRGKGLGKKLCEALKERCAAKNISRIYWHTQESNETARKLYDQIATKDDFIRYVMPLELA